MQVAFMADIYKEVRTVLIWLGEENSDNLTAFTFLRCQKNKKPFEAEKNALEKTSKVVIGISCGWCKRYTMRRN